MNIYVASSWRNSYQPQIVKLLRAQGHHVYDFLNPAGGDHGFSWSEIDAAPGKGSWTPRKFREKIEHPAAERGYRFDADALFRCRACLLVLPCGKSAHLELGWALGAGRYGAVYANERDSFEPELMYKLCGRGSGTLPVLLDEAEVVAWASDPDKWEPK